MQVNKRPPEIHTAFNPVVLKLSLSSGETTTSASITITSNGESITLKREFLNGNAVFEISAILKSLFSKNVSVSPVSNKILIDGKLFVEYTITGDANIETLYSIMTGSDLKTVGATWTINKTGVTPSLYFDASDNFVFSIFDASPFIDTYTGSSTPQVEAHESLIVESVVTGQYVLRSQNIAFPDVSTKGYTITGNTLTILETGTITIKGKIEITTADGLGAGTASPSYIAFGSHQCPADNEAGEENIDQTFPVDLSFSVTKGDVLDISAHVGFGFERGLTDAVTVYIKSVNDAGEESPLSIELTPNSFKSINYKVKVLDSSANVLYTQAISYTEKSANNIYAKATDFASIFSMSTQPLTIQMLEVTDSIGTETQIATTQVYYINDSTFLNPTTRVFEGMPFYGFSNKLTALNSVVQIGESSDFSNRKGTFLTKFTKVKKYEGFPLMVTCLGFDNSFIDISGTLLNDNENPITDKVFCVVIDNSGFVGLSNIYSIEHYLLTNNSEIITDNEGNPITVREQSTGYVENRITIESACAPAAPFYIRWINQLGGYEHWMFEKKQTIKNKISGKVEYSPVVYDQLTAETFSKTIELDVSNDIIVGCEGLTELEYSVVSKAIMSPRIEYFDTEKQAWLLINVSEADVSLDTGESTQSLEITFSLPKIQTQF